MSRISLSSVINDSFINRFRGVALNQLGKSSPLSSGGDEPPSISEGLRVGARTFASAVQTLNSGIAVINTTETSLSALTEITQKLIDVSEEATSSSIGTQRRRRLNIEFKDLVLGFKDALEANGEGEIDFLKAEDLSTVLTNIGLDPEESSEIGKLFSSLLVSEEGSNGSLVDEDTQGQGQVRLPSSITASRKQSVAERSIFDSETNILTRSNAFEVLHDLKELKGQLSENTETVGKIREKLGQNLELVRSAGLAFLEASEQIGDVSDAEEVARRLRTEIRKNAGAALSKRQILNQ
jgi:hypothetical protein